jgi:hypothetical protein
MVKTRIKLNLKTFHGSRKIYEIEAEITDTIEKLRARLISMDEDKELASCKQIRLIHTIVPCFIIRYPLLLGKDKGSA